MGLTRRYVQLAIGVGIIAVSALAQVLAQDTSTTTIEFNLEAQPLTQALNQWAMQSGLQVLWPALDAPKRLNSASVRGQFEPMRALHELLEGTGLTFSVVGDGKAVVIHEDKAKKDRGGALDSGKGYKTKEIAFMATSGRTEKKLHSSKRDSAFYRDIGVEEVVVTGTHLQGGNPTSKAMVFTRDEIDRMGVGTAQEFISRLPQNFNGGAVESTIGALLGGNADQSVGATGLNLRGLGTDATLVLINGRRVAPTGDNGNIVDVSMIPMSAVERVEVLTDGASAIYGSDAVGGVVNFILDRGFSGAETRARYGTVSSGGSTKQQIGQSLGTTWSSGSAVVSYEFLEQKPLLASEREYARGAADPFYLIPPQKRHGAFLSIQQEVGSRTDVFIDGLFSRRTSSQDIAFNGADGLPFSGSTSDSEISAYSANVGAVVEIPAIKGNFEISTSMSKSLLDRMSTLRLIRAGVVFPAADNSTNTKLWSVDPKITGTLSQTAYGDLRYALGAQYRSESLELNDRLAASLYDSPNREIVAAFAELAIPLPANVDLSIAGRTEHYSDFGSTTNPKLGLRWKPSESVSLRGSYSTSFKAPLLYDTNPNPTQYFTYELTEAQAGAVTRAIVEMGGNDKLRAEKAKTWNVGIDFSSSEHPGTNVGLSYYHLDFKDRVESVLDSISNLTEILRFEPVLGPNIIIRQPDAGTVAGLVASPVFVDLLGDFDPSQVGVIVDGRQQNLAKVTTSGLDLTANHKMGTALGDITFGANATYAFEFSHKFVDRASPVEFLNSPYNPVDLRARAHVTLAKSGATLSWYADYVDDYSTRLSGVRVPISSWTTMDLVGTYTFESNGGMPETEVVLGVLNVADKEPPYVQNSNSTLGLNYDGTNANALGRFYSVQVSARW